MGEEIIRFFIIKQKRQKKKTLDYVSCFPLYFFRALPPCSITEQSTAQAFLFVYQQSWTEDIKSPLISVMINSHQKRFSSNVAVANLTRVKVDDSCWYNCLNIMIFHVYDSVVVPVVL